MTVIITLCLVGLVIMLILATVGFSGGRKGTLVCNSSSRCLLSSIQNDMWHESESCPDFFWRHNSCKELTERLKEGTFVPQGRQEHDTVDALAGIGQYRPAVEFLLTTDWGRRELLRLYNSDDHTCFRPGAKRLIHKVVSRTKSPPLILIGPPN